MSRDVYDIFSLLEHVDEGKVLDGLPRKLATRDADVAALDRGRLTDRKEEFRADWDRNLVHLLPPGTDRNFEEVWEELIAHVNGVTDALDRDRKRAQ